MSELNIGAFEGDNSKEVDGLYDALVELDTRTASQIVACTLTVGTEDTNVINVAAQLAAVDAIALTAPIALQWYLSGDSAGAGLLATAPTGGIAVGTDGDIITVHDTNKSGMVLSSITGVFDFDITDTGTPTMYLVVVLPNGALSVSDAITFA